MNRRRDRLTALYVDAAIHTCTSHGVEIAAMALADQNVSRSVILRVLTCPRQRRGAGQRTELMDHALGESE